MPHPIVSDLAAGLVGGLGVVPGANLGDISSKDLSARRTGDSHVVLWRRSLEQLELVKKDQNDRYGSHKSNQK